LESKTTAKNPSFICDNSVTQIEEHVMANISEGIEPNTRKFLDEVNAATGPQIYELTVEQARAAMSGLQKGQVPKGSVLIEEHSMPTPHGDVALRVVRPKDAKGRLPALVYFHGAGWVLGGWDTHERLLVELATRAQIAVVYVDFTRSPEAKYPVAIEQCYAAAKYVAENGSALNIDARNIAIGGDSVGGNMTIAVAMLCKQRGGPKVNAQLLFYPVTDANFDTGSYNQFATNHFLTREAMKWFWNHYCDQSKRNEPTASPLRASKDQLEGLPQAIILTAEFDVLRDEGEAFAHKLSQSGVSVTAVRCLGTIHDFAMLNAIKDTPASRFAIHTAAQFLRERLLKTEAAALA
jgi:acetyl esterase